MFGELSKDPKIPLRRCGSASISVDHVPSQAHITSTFLSPAPKHAAASRLPSATLTCNNAWGLLHEAACTSSNEQLHSSPPHCLGFSPRAIRCCVSSTLFSPDLLLRSLQPRYCRATYPSCADEGGGTKLHPYRPVKHGRSHLYIANQDPKTCLSYQDLGLRRRR